ncbi:hypothetical protein B0H13DRAFT_2346905 [Mycena leptocephala]|nr:hypothetical protein B0H13DRAFT_2346905 [Mycena leptocephala]
MHFVPYRSSRMLVAYKYRGAIASLLHSSTHHPLRPLPSFTDTQPLRSSTLLSSLPSPSPLNVGPLATRHSTRPTRRHRQCLRHLIARSSTAFIDLLNHSPLRRCRYRCTLAAPESMDLGVTLSQERISPPTRLAPFSTCGVIPCNLPELSPWDLFLYRLRSFLLAPVILTES